MVLLSTTNYGVPTVTHCYALLNNNVIIPDPELNKIGNNTI